MSASRLAKRLCGRTIGVHLDAVKFDGLFGFRESPVIES